MRGDSDEKESVRGDIAQEAALALIRLIRDDDIVAVSGGALMAELAEMLPKLHMNVDVLPIRRGFGRRIDFYQIMWQLIWLKIRREVSHPSNTGWIESRVFYKLKKNCRRSIRQKNCFQKRVYWLLV